MFTKVAGAVVYNGDLIEPRGPRRLAVRANQAIFERGGSAPWIWSAEQCRQHWASADDGREGNAPTDYSGKNRAIVGLLNDFWQPEVSPEDHVFEVACNAGANLKGLHERGFRKLSAAE